jgi:Protein of unknwon function (DUF3310)
VDNERTNGHTYKRLQTHTEMRETFVTVTQDNDAVNHPSHYTAYNGLEVIDLTEQMNFNKGNAVKYVCRAGLKDKTKEVEDLEKAVWYLQREIERVKKEQEREDDIKPLSPESMRVEGDFQIATPVLLELCPRCCQTTLGPVGTSRLMLICANCNARPYVNTMYARRYPQCPICRLEMKKTEPMMTEHNAYFCERDHGWATWNGVSRFVWVAKR